MVLELETEARDLIVMALDKFIAAGDYEVSGVAEAPGRPRGRHSLTLPPFA